jgi:septal ring factor EnvC (AmiA/AmiB activator)
MSEDKFPHTSHDLALVQDWLDAKGYSGESKTVMDAMDLIASLRAELAAEREKTADLGKQIDRLADEVDWVEDEVGAQEKALEEVEAERDALRALLREARKLINRCDPQDFFNMLARIDAALNEGGRDEG